MARTRVGERLARVRKRLLDLLRRLLRLKPLSQPHFDISKAAMPVESCQCRSLTLSPSRCPQTALKAAITGRAGLVNMENSSRTAKNARAACCARICGIKIDVLLARDPAWPWAPVRALLLLSSETFALQLHVFNSCRILTFVADTATHAATHTRHILIPLLLTGTVQLLRCGCCLGQLMKPQ